MLPAEHVFHVSRNRTPCRAGRKHVDAERVRFHNTGPQAVASVDRYAALCPIRAWVLRLQSISLSDPMASPHPDGCSGIIGFQTLPIVSKARIDHWDRRAMLKRRQLLSRPGDARGPGAMPAAQYPSAFPRMAMSLLLQRGQGLALDCPSTIRLTSSFRHIAEQSAR
jgi:hypothetical protein